MRAALVALVLAALGCGNDREALLVAVALTESDHVAVRLAVDEINGAGGIDGRPIELTGLEWRFTDSTTEDSLMWAERLSSTPGVVAVIGHADSASTLAAAAIYNQRGLPNLVTIASHPAITRIGDYTYRLCSSDARQAQVLAHHAVRDLGARDIAVFFVNDDYGRGLAQLFRTEAERLGGRIVSSVFHRNLLRDEDRELIDAVLGRLRAEGPPDLFVLIQRVDAALYTLRRMGELGFETPVLGSESVAGAQTSLARSAPEARLRITSFVDPVPSHPRALKFLRDFEERAGYASDYSRAFAYDAVYLLRDALAGGGTTRAGVKRHLDSMIERAATVEGVTGRYGFREDHDAYRDMYVAEIDRSGIRRIKVFPPDWQPAGPSGKPGAAPGPRPASAAALRSPATRTVL